MMRGAQIGLLIFWIALATLTGCSGDGGATNVTGTWCRTSPGEGMSWVRLEQSGSSVSGTICEKPGGAGGCYPIASGQVTGDKVTFFYSWEEDHRGSGSPQTYICNVTINFGGNTATGTVTCTKGGFGSAQFSRC